MHVEPNIEHRADDTGAKAVLRFVRLSATNKMVLVEAFLLVAFASLAIKLLPFRRTATLMQRPVRTRSLDAEKRDCAVRQCRWAVERCAGWAPWRAVCFQRGLALQFMLRRRGIHSVLHYGVAQNVEKGLQAHVWLEVAGRTVLGGEEAPGFARLASFPATPRI